MHSARLNRRHWGTNAHAKSAAEAVGKAPGMDPRHSAINGGEYWYREQDSNLHASRRWLLRPLRLPIPPSRPGRNLAHSGVHASAEKGIPSDIAARQNVLAMFQRRDSKAPGVGVSENMNGERAGNRTPNLVVKSHLLCQLSYAPGRTLRRRRVTGNSFARRKCTEARSIGRGSKTAATRRLDHQAVTRGEFDGAMAREFFLASIPAHQPIAPHRTR